MRKEAEYLVEIVVLVVVCGVRRVFLYPNQTEHSDFARIIERLML